MTAEQLIYSWVLLNPEFKNASEFEFMDWWYSMLDFCKKIGLKTPSQVGIAGLTFHKNTLMDFSKGQKKLLQADFKNLHRITIYFQESEHLDPLHYWEAAINISVNEFLGLRLYFSVKFDLIRDQLPELKALLIKICALTKASYGYAYLKKLKESPFSYAAGYIHEFPENPLSEQEKDIINKWGNNQNLITEGNLRDLYPINILSDKLLNRKINGISLEKWINKDNTRGTLTELYNGCHLWQIPSLHYPKVRKELGGKGLLIAYSEEILPSILFDEFLP